MFKKKNGMSGKIFYTPMEKYWLRFSNIFFYSCVVVCFLIVAFNVTFSSATIIGVSMQPTYNSQWTNSNSPTDTAYYSVTMTPNRGDIIVVDLSFTNDSEYEKFGIKRLIATQGDVVEFIGYELYINGEKQDQSYLRKLDDNKFTISSIVNGIKYANENWSLIEYNEETCNNNYVKFQVPEGYFFYLGDNRVASYDCSAYGPQKNENLLAKIAFVVPYNTNLVSYLWQSFCNLFK